MNENAPPKRSFNLLTDPWIPIAGVGLVSLYDIFTHPEYTRLGGTPIEKVVLLRLLLCVVHASSPVPDLKSWSELTLPKLASNALEYLQKWSDRFDLYDEIHPFLQIPHLKGGKVETWWHLSVSASDNNSILTQNDFTENYSEAEKARLLLCGVCYSCRRKGQKVLSSYSLMGEKGFLHTFIIGKSILETIYLNLLTLENIREIHIFDDELFGKPFWELDYTTPKWGDKYQKSYLGCLFPLNKFLYIEGEGVRRDEGISYPEFSEGQWDPGITIYENEKDKKRNAVLCSTEKLPWRSLGSIFIVAMKETKGNLISSAFLKYGIRRIQKSKFISTFGIWCGGVAVKTDTIKTQKISGKNGFVESEFQITLSDYDDPWWERYEQYIVTLGMYAYSVKSAVMRYYREITDPEKDPTKLKKFSPFCKSQGEESERLFWEKMNLLAQSILELAFQKEDPEKVKDAKKKWRKVGYSCYEDFCPSETPRQIQAFVKFSPGFNYNSKEKETKNG